MLQRVSTFKVGWVDAQGVGVEHVGARVIQIMPQGNRPIHNCPDQPMRRPHYPLWRLLPIVVQINDRSPIDRLYPFTGSSRSLPHPTPIPILLEHRREPRQRRNPNPLLWCVFDSNPRIWSPFHRFRFAPYGRGEGCGRPSGTING